jgi:hypothetical protein
LAIQRVKSKWAKTNVLLQSETVSFYVPATIKWSRDGLESMLSLYGMIYAKPDRGTFGKGVIRIEKRADDLYTYQLGTKLYTFYSLNEMADRLQLAFGGRPYLLQRGIELLKYDERRFDIRVMVQKNLQKRWETTGIIGRLSHPAKIVTNYHSGGTPMSFEKLMSSHLPDPEIETYKNRLQSLGVLVARQMQLQYPRLKEIGIDIAVDEQLMPWILEVNTFPDPFIFRKLPDKSVYRKVRRYCIAYGRLKAKRAR